jgi:nicotinate-nucleotide adenylyltransferase
MNIDELKLVTEKVKLYALGVLAPPRYEHSVRVAVMSRDLCARFGLVPETGYFAGIAHDICKAGKEKWLLSLAAQDDIPISEIEERKPSLLHGRAAAVVLRTEFGITDSSILAAVRNHTFGAPDIDDLGKIVFVSDKIEPGRTGLDPEFRANVLASDLDDMTRLVLEDNIRYLKSKDKEVSGVTLEMLESLNRRSKGK